MLKNLTWDQGLGLTGGRFYVDLSVLSDAESVIWNISSEPAALPG
jgi:hypothetical protein